MIANSLKEILENFDFTDSIIIAVKWSENLVDLTMIIDYYWDVQEGRDKTRLFRITFKNCINATFRLRNKLPILDNMTNISSYFTIIQFSENNEGRQNENKHIEIYTTDYSNPWLIAVCSEVLMEEYEPAGGEIA